MTPGKKQLNNYKDIKLFEQICKFIFKSKRDNFGQCADIGPVNVKSKYVYRWFNIPMVDQYQIDVSDFDFDHIFYAYYDTIFCFEILEHLTNPKFFMEQLSELLLFDGTIFLSTPARPKILWDKHHFNEISSKRLEKWILKPLGLRIIRKQRIRPTHSWLFYLSGFRPFLRLFFNYSIIYEIKKI